jgi:hypothetical protein
MRQTILNIKKYFTVWWIPIIGNFVAIIIFFLGTLFERDWIIDFSLIIFYLNTIGTIISSIVQIINRKWYFIFPQLGLSAVLFFYMSLIFIFSPPDYYGANKNIPENIIFSEPLDSFPSSKEFELFDLILMNYGQPGIYKYYTDYVPKEFGSFYIKCYEVTSNDRLSEDRIKEKSLIKVDNYDLQQFEGEFTIYEGDWGDKYGSRIELWFQPSNGNQEYKIVERNYIIEGWQR